EAAKLYHEIAVKNPFIEKSVLAAAKLFKNDNDALQAYDLLRQAVEINAKSKELHKQYILSALVIGLNVYAESALDDLKELVTETEYKDFLKEYNSRLEILKQEYSDWD
ncbi:MAG: hypothetical protein M3421_11060, partial [Bacteroidota bacterium]|nr:hypothetical protein [Bacteroidota bacterium]